MWFDECVFYQIYPLGYCGAEWENDFGEVRHRLHKIKERIPELKRLGVGAVLFNPLFESERHGYDTVEFKELVEALHDNGIRVVLDGVFHHTRRKFAPFEEVKRLREGTPYRFWFHLDFRGNSPYNDGFGYQNWEGHAELVKLRLENEDLQRYLMDAVRFWIDEFGIDGLRLDVAYSLPAWFMEMLRRVVREKREDFFLMGETIHLQNFLRYLTPACLDSATDYECFHGMVSAFNSRNLFEIEHSMTRLFADLPWAIAKGKNLFNFADNHDVARAATALRERRNLKGLYTLLFTMPGIPCVYYGSEHGAEGNKGNNDRDLRPPVETIGRDEDLFAHLARLARIRSSSRALAYGRKIALGNLYLAVAREGEGRVITAINIDGAPCTLNVGTGEGRDLLTGETLSLSALTLPPYSAFVIEV